MKKYLIIIVIALLSILGGYLFSRKTPEDKMKEQIIKCDEKCKDLGIYARQCYEGCIK